MQAKEQVQKVALATAPRKKRAAPRSVRPLPSLDDKRQSSRLKGVAPKNYNESVLDQLELKERGAGRKSKLPALFGKTVVLQLLQLCFRVNVVQ